jgi:hypothetical protein
MLPFDGNPWDKHWPNLSMDIDVYFYFAVAIVRILQLYHVELLIVHLELEFVDSMSYVRFRVDVTFQSADSNSKDEHHRWDTYAQHIPIWTLSIRCCCRCCSINDLTLEYWYLTMATHVSIDKRSFVFFEWLAIVSTWSRWSSLRKKLTDRSTKRKRQCFLPETSPLESIDIYHLVASHLSSKISKEVNDHDHTYCSVPFLSLSLLLFLFFVGHSLTVHICFTAFWTIS